MDSYVRTSQSERRQALSSMLDGDMVDADLACRAWSEDPQSRADWHAYHVIGEVMRSDDTRAAPAHDLRFLSRLRARMASEPVMLAPRAAAPHGRPAWSLGSWVAPLAVGAGFLAVAGVVVVAGVAVPVDVQHDSSARIAGAATSGGAVAVQAGVTGASAMPQAGDGVLIRSAELDRYLAAHKQYSSSSALAVPGGAVRNAATTAPGR